MPQTVDSLVEELRKRKQAVGYKKWLRALGHAGVSPYTAYFWMAKGKHTTPTLQLYVWLMSELGARVMFQAEDGFTYVPLDNQGRLNTEPIRAAYRKKKKRLNRNIYLWEKDSFPKLNTLLKARDEVGMRIVVEDVAQDGE